MTIRATDIQTLGNHILRDMRIVVKDNVYHAPCQIFRTLLNLQASPQTVPLDQRTCAETVTNPDTRIVRDFAYLGTADAGDCSGRTVQALRLNLQCSGSTKAHLNTAGRRCYVTPAMLDGFYEKLLEKPNLYPNKMAVNICDEAGIWQIFMKIVLNWTIWGRKITLVRLLDTQGAHIGAKGNDG